MSLGKIRRSKRTKLKSFNNLYLYFKNISLKLIIPLQKKVDAALYSVLCFTRYLGLDFSIKYASIYISTILNLINVEENVH